MSTLIALAFNDPYRAEEVRLELLRKHGSDLGDLEEAVVLVHDWKNKIRLHHATHLTFPAALSGGFLGTLVGLMVFNPILALIGGVTGTGLGAAIGAVKEVGIEEDFMEELGRGLKPGSSALFILARRTAPDKIVDALKDSGGKVLQTSLSHDDETKLKAALNEVQSSGAASNRP